MGKKVGKLIKDARQAAGLTQEQLAKKVKGASASDIGRAERGEKELTQEQLKAIAKATGVTQKSLLDAAKGTSSSSTAKKKTSTSSSSTAKKKTSTTSSSSSGYNAKLTDAEKKMLTAYRKADAATKKKVLELLEKDSSAAQEFLGNVLEEILNNLSKK